MGQKENYATWLERNRAAYNARRRQKRRDNPMATRANDRKYQRKAKADTLGYYSSGAMCCIRCGYLDDRALSIDHINGGGYKERMRRKSGNIYNYLRGRGYPDGFQVLCMNCQFIKRLENKETNEK